MEVVDAAKYLGITDLRWNKHIRDITTKANNSLAFLKRKICVQSADRKETSYKALVRPQIEYASSVWDPHTSANIHLIEMVQRRAARWVLSKYRHGPNTTSVSDMLLHLQWQTLAERRRHARLVLLYKIVHNLVAINIYTHLSQQLLRRSTRNTNAHQFTVPDSRVDYHKYSFFPRTAREWNSLPAHVVSATSLDSFKCLMMSNT